MKKWRKLHIRGRMILIVLSTSLTTLLLLSAIGFYGMFDVRSEAIESGHIIGRAATESSSEALIAQKKAEMQSIVIDRAGDISGKLEGIRRDVRVLSAAMTDIETHPENYLPRTVLPPDARNGGILATQLLIAPTISDLHAPALAAEIGRAGNIARISYDFMQMNRYMVTAFAASEQGFTILTDRYSDLQGDFFDARTRPWYTLAKERGELVFSDVLRDALNGELCLFCSMPYERQGEFAGVVAMGAYITDLKNIIDSVNDYHGQFGFVMDEKGRVILSTFSASDTDDLSTALTVNVDDDVDLRTNATASIAHVAQQITSGAQGVIEADVGGETYYIAYAPVEGTGWTCAVGIPAHEVVAPALQNNKVIDEMTDRSIAALDASMMRIALLIMCAVAALIVCVVYAGRRISDHFVRPIRTLSDGVREIASGNLEKKLDIRTGDEIESLALSFNAMTDELTAYMKNLAAVTAREERIATELAVATRIQENMLPNIFPPFPDRREFDIFASMQPAKEIGGDFYDFYLLDEHRVVITIADVSGKGIPAALFMVVAKVVLKNFVRMTAEGAALSDAAAEANAQLCQNNETMMFVTAFIGILDFRDGTLTYVNAGHTPPLVYRAQEERFSYLPVARNFVLGAMEDFTYAEQRVHLGCGDVLLLYTDGVTEAANARDELYGEERLLAALNDAHAAWLPLKELFSRLRASIDSFVQEAEQADDMTMLALAFYGEDTRNNKEVDL